MREYSKELKTRKIDIAKLLEYGFILENEVYKYQTNIIDNLFRVEVEIIKNSMTSKLIETEFDEEYLQADNINATGEYSGKIKDEYNSIVEDIFNKCTYKDPFKYEQTKEVIRYIKSKYNDDLEYLWEKFDDNAIWRNKENNKWYGLLLTASKNKFGFKEEERVEVIDLMYQKEDIDKIVDNKIIFPGYHMNKKSWISIILDGSVEINKIKELIDNSYNIVKDK